MRPRSFVLLLLAPTVLLAACSDGGAARSADGRPNVVLVVVDTLRRDRLSCYGAERNTSPVIDRLASESVRFDKAYATAPWTSPSVASMLTGMLPSAHGLEQQRVGLNEEIETLAEMLRDAGYATAGIVSNPHLKNSFAFHQGFTHWFQNHAQGHKNLTTPGVTDQAVRMVQELASGDTPFFLFALYFDPHYDYLRHEEFGFADPADAGRAATSEHMLDLRALDLTGEEIAYLRDVYDEEIRFTDAGIGRLLDALREAGVYDDTVIVFTADHGEEFMERGWLGHCRTLYDELVNVPLIVKLPGARDTTAGTTGLVVDTPVSLTSLVPTLREYAGLVANTPRANAPSLAPLLRGDTVDAWPPVFCEVDLVPSADPNQEAHKRALIGEGHKLVHDDVTGVIELYDLAADPLEREDLVDAKPELAARLLAQLELIHAGAESMATEGTDVELSEDDKAALHALGYSGFEPEESEGNEAPETGGQ